MESLSETYEELLMQPGIDGMAEVIPGKKQDVSTSVINSLHNLLKLGSSPSCYGDVFERQVEFDKAFNEILSPEPLTDDQLAFSPDFLTTWHMHPRHETAYALALHMREGDNRATFVKIDVSGQETKTSTKLFDLNISNPTTDDITSEATRLSRRATHADIEVLAALIEKSRNSICDREPPDNSPLVLAELFGDNVDEFVDDEDVTINKFLAEEDEVFETIYDKNLSRDARRIFRKHFNLKKGPLRISLEYVDEEGTGYYVDIQGKRRNNRDHEITSLRLIGQNEFVCEKIDYLNAEEGSNEKLSWLARETHSIEEAVERGDIVPPEVFDTIWDDYQTTD